MIKNVYINQLSRHFHVPNSFEAYKSPTSGKKKHSGECAQDDSAMAAFALGSGDNLRTNRGVYFEIDKQKYKIYRSAPWI